MHADSSYREFALEPLTVKPAPPAAQPLFTTPPEFSATAAPTAITAAPAPLEQPAARAATAPAPTASGAPRTSGVDPINLPRFLYTRPEPGSRGLWALLIITVALTVGAGFHTRAQWAPRLTAVIWPPPPPTPMPLGLNAIDVAGQLQIRWNGGAPAIRNAVDALLVIVDGPAPESIPLDAAHLVAGVFTYQRRTGKVDVTLSVRQPDGREVREATTFLGSLPEAALSDAQRELLTREAARLKSDLNAQTERADELEKALRSELKKQPKTQQNRKARQLRLEALSRNLCSLYTPQQ